MSKDHTVQNGDCISSIAYENGLDEVYLWNLAENSDLKSLRKDPDVLLPGDIVYVPEPRQRNSGAPTEQKARFRRKNVPAKFLVAFEMDGEPRSDENVKVEVDDIEAGEFTTDGKGSIEVPIKPNASKLIVTFTTNESNPEVHEFDLGGIDPLDSIRGQKARLANLGLFIGEVDESADDELKDSLSRFQKRHGLRETGSADTATLDKLKEIYGS